MQPQYTPTEAQYTTAKAWVALMFLIITSILTSDLVPVSGKVHTILAIASVILGAVSTWATKNKVKNV